MVWPSDEPDHLIKHLQENGFSFIGDRPGMGMDLSLLKDEEIMIPKFNITAVKNHEEMNIFKKVLKEGFEITHELAEGIATMVDHELSLHVIGWLD